MCLDIDVYIQNQTVHNGILRYHPFGDLQGIDHKLHYDHLKNRKSYKLYYKLTDLNLTKLSN